MRYYLMWQSDPATTMTVNWVDLHTGSSLDVHYRRIGETPWSKATGAKFSTADTSGVTAVFEHDHHNYKRTYRLRGHKRDDANSIMYATTSGKSICAPTEHPPFAPWISGKPFDKVELLTPRPKPVE